MRHRDMLRARLMLVRKRVHPRLLWTRSHGITQLDHRVGDDRRDDTPLCSDTTRATQTYCAQRKETQMEPYLSTMSYTKWVTIIVMFILFPFLIFLVLAVLIAIMVSG